MGGSKKDWIRNSENNGASSARFFEGKGDIVQLIGFFFHRTLNMLNHFRSFSHGVGTLRPELVF